jgi:hypothetical protein
MPYPDVRAAQSLGFDESVVHSCCAQIYLRKVTNEIYRLLGDVRNLQAPFSVPLRSVIEYAEGSLKVHHFMPPGFELHPFQIKARFSMLVSVSG